MGLENQDYFHGTKLFFDFINDYYYLTTLIHFLFATLYEHLFTTVHEHSDGTKLFLASPLKGILFATLCALFHEHFSGTKLIFLLSLRINILQLYAILFSE